MSVVVVATILPLPEHRDEVIAAFEKAIARVHDEDGCELYALHTNDDKLVMIEKWATADALKVHGRGAALVELGGTLQGKLTGPLDVQVFDPHPAGGDKGVL